jgi:hypothetical protein
VCARVKRGVEQHEDYLLKDEYGLVYIILPSNLRTEQYVSLSDRRQRAGSSNVLSAPPYIVLSRAALLLVRQRTNLPGKSMSLHGIIPVHNTLIFDSYCMHFTIVSILEIQFWGIVDTFPE